LAGAAFVVAGVAAVAGDGAVAGGTIATAVAFTWNTPLETVGQLNHDSQPSAPYASKPAQSVGLELDIVRRSNRQVLCQPPAFPGGHALTEQKRIAPTANVIAAPRLMCRNRVACM